MLVAEPVLEAVAELIAKCAWKSEIIDKVNEMTGKKVDGASVNRVIARARELMKERWNLTDDELRQESMTFYGTFLGDDSVEPQNRIKARERIDKLMGLEKADGKAQSAIEVAQDIITALGTADGLMDLDEEGKDE